MKTMKFFFYKLWSKFLTYFSNVKIFSFPFWLIYDPDDYQITGKQVLEIMEILKPGDIIIRGFRHYLDGKFIPSKSGWSHGAIYIGDNQIIHAVSENTSKINVIDFTRCDRIGILRPRKGQRKAISLAKKFVKDQIPYDFGFSNGCSALYCFELCKECYPTLQIERQIAKKFFGLVKKDVYLAESLLDSPDFECIYQYNPQFDIDFRK